MSIEGNVELGLYPWADKRIDNAFEIPANIHFEISAFQLAEFAGAHIE